MKAEVRKEREANLFAMALLMPRELLAKELQGVEFVSYERLHQLARKFQVTSELMILRLIELGYSVEPT